MAINFTVDLNNIPELLDCVEQIKTPTTFLQDYFFSQNVPVDADSVYVELMEGTDRASVYVADMSDGIPDERTSYEVELFEPPMIATKRVISGKDLKTKQFREALFQNIRNPEDRATAIRLRDFQEMKAQQDRKREAMCAEVIFNNSLTIREYVDDLGKEHDPKFIKFYKNDPKEAVYDVTVGGAYWTTTRASGIQMYDDIYAMIEMLDERQLPHDILLVSPEVMSVMIQNEYWLELQDNRRLDLININPEALPAGVTHFGKLNVYGHMVEIYSYNGSYTDPTTGERKTYVPKGKVALGSFDTGRIVYGRVFQAEEDGWHTYAGVDIPKYSYDPRGMGSEESSLKSRPLPMPFQRNSFIVSQVLDPA